MATERTSSLTFAKPGQFVADALFGEAARQGWLPRAQPNGRFTTSRPRGTTISVVIQAASQDDSQVLATIRVESNGTNHQHLIDQLIQPVRMHLVTDEPSQGTFSSRAVPKRSDPRGIEAATAALGGIGKFFGRRELAKLDEILRDQERVQALGQGALDNHQGIVVVTPERMIFFDKTIAGRRIEEFPLRAISSVSSSSGIVHDKMAVTVSGHRSVIENMTKGSAARLATAVRDMQMKASAPAPVAAAEPKAAPADPLEQLEKLGRLRDAGVVSTEEFETKKAALLDRL